MQIPGEKNKNNSIQPNLSCKHDNHDTKNIIHTIFAGTLELSEQTYLVSLYKLQYKDEEWSENKKV